MKKIIGILILTISMFACKSKKKNTTEIKTFPNNQQIQAIKKNQEEYTKVWNKTRKTKMYLDSAWQISAKENASYYRTITKEGKRYKIQFFYVNGILRSKEYWTNSKDRFREGTTTYYDLQGKKYLEEKYKKNILKEENNYSEEGSLISSGNYKENAPYTGTFIWGVCTCDIIAFKNGKKTSLKRYYTDTNVVAEITYYDKEEKPTNMQFFNQKGEKIGELQIEQNKNYRKNRKPIEGIYIGFQESKEHKIRYKLWKAKYKKELLQGEYIDYDSKGKELAKGMMKNNKPFSGTFFESGELVTYKKGIKQKK